MYSHQNLRLLHGDLTKAEASILSAAFIDKSALQADRCGLNVEEFRGVCSTLIASGFLSPDPPHQITDRGVERYRSHLESERASLASNRAGWFFAAIAFAIVLIYFIISSIIRV